jgi:hypothetical protein
LGQVKANQQDGNRGPGEVALGSAGNSAVQEGK